MSELTRRLGVCRAEGAAGCGLGLFDAWFTRRHSDCQRSPKARTSLLARSWAKRVEVVSVLLYSHVYSLVSSASPTDLENLPWVPLSCFTASRVVSHWASSLPGP